MTGLMTVWADGVPKDLGEGDFAMVPAYHNHTYQFIAQETEFLGLVQPAGFDDFFANVSSPWAPKHNVPFPPDQGIAFPGQKFQAAVKQHLAYASAAADGQGVDRHLFGLKKLLQEGEAVPALYEDPAYGLSSTWKLSTSQISSEVFDNW